MDLPTDDETTARYALTGANGYVGSILSRVLGPHGGVTALVRQPRSRTDVAWSFLSSVDVAPQLREHRVRVLVHSAWDMTASSPEEVDRICVEGSRRLFEAADRAGVERIVFISTISAFAGCRSVYGQSKVKVEEMVRMRGGTVLRLGLVFGPEPAAAFGNLYDQVCRSAFVPVINRGHEPQYLLAVETLKETILRAVQGEFDSLKGQPLTLAHPQPWSFRQLVQEIGRLKGCRPKIVPVPWRFLHGGLRMAEALGLKLPFRSDSVISVVYANPTPEFNTMASYRISPIPFPQGMTRPDDRNLLSERNSAGDDRTT